jgi:glutathione S-transferase
VADAIILYGPARAPYTEKCRRALVLKQLDFALREPSGPEDYKRWSPHTGLLPVLTIGDELVSDSTAILERLDALYPSPPLLSTDPKVAEQQRNLEEWADESFLWYFQQWQRIAALHPPAAAAAGRSPVSRRLLAWLRAGGTWERPHTAILRSIDDRFGDLVNFLGARPFFYSDQVSMADLAVYGMLYTIRLDAIPGAARLLAGRATLLDFMQRVEGRTGG